MDIYTQKEVIDWIGIDLDRTLAYYETRVDFNPMEIGQIIPRAKEYVIDLIKKGEKEGFVVKIFTARAVFPNTIPIIQKWLIDNGLPKLDVTNAKDQGTILIIDDIARQMIPNTGIIINDYFNEKWNNALGMISKVYGEAITRDGISLETIDQLRDFLKIHQK